MLVYVCTYNIYSPHYDHYAMSASHNQNGRWEESATESRERRVSVSFYDAMAAIYVVQDIINFKIFAESHALI